MDFLQNKTKFLFHKYEILSTEIEGDKGKSEIKYDWGIKLPIAVDLGDPNFQTGAVLHEEYSFDKNAMKWYFIKAEHEKGTRKKQ